MTQLKSYYDFLVCCPGLAGDIAREIYTRLEYDVPHLALGSALAFTSALVSNRYKNPWGIAPCLYVALVGATGVGKSHANSIMQEIAIEAGAHEIFMGKPKSDSALVDALSEGEHRKFLVWDEFGPALSALSKSKNSYDATLLAVMMDLYSAAGKWYRGNEYSKGSLRGARVDIEAPYLAVLASSTPIRFFEALNHYFIHDGFLSRMLLFVDGKETKFKGKSPTNGPVSHQVVEGVKRVNAVELVNEGGDLTRLTKVKVANVHFRKEAYDRALLFKEVCKETVGNAIDEIERVFFSRAFEQCVRIATTLSDTGDCDLETWEFSEQLVIRLISSAISHSQECIFGSEQERKESKVKDFLLSMMKVGERISKTELYLKARRIADTATRQKEVSELLSAGIWEAEKQFSPHDTTKYVTFFKRIK